jgi:curved DNA-binding protein
MIEAKTLDYYEFLQISPHADSETIHRVYKFLAARFHPDNPDSGDPEKFFLLKAAYDVLSDLDRRAAYDTEYQQHANERPVHAPLSNSVDFLDQIQGEMNRRMAVLAVLYYRRRSNPFAPEVSLAEIEKRMGFPRDYLDFTTWYLTRKGYIVRADNSDFSLTAEGVDFVETQRANMPVLSKLLTNGNAPCNMDVDGGPAPVESSTVIESDGAHFVLLNDNTQIPDRRKNGKDRRVGNPDPRANRFERRVNQRARRANENQPVAGVSA